MATRGAGADLRPVLCDPRPLARRLRRCPAQTKRDVRQQRHQGGGLPDDAVRHPPADGLRRGGPGRSRLLAGQVRHPHRAAPGFAAGQGQRLDRGPDHRLHHPGDPAGRPARGTHDFHPTAVGRRALYPDRNRYAARSSHLRSDLHLHGGGLVQPAHSAHGRGNAPHAEEPAGAGARFLDLQLAAVARQAGADLAGDDHAVLGRERQPGAPRHWATAPRRRPRWAAW
jgi:hypothetical protein